MYWIWVVEVGEMSIYFLNLWGKNGNVVGLDMTENQLKIANDNLSYQKI